MKATASTCLFALIASLGLATPPALNLPSVGPAAPQSSVSAHTGTLVVYSAYSVHGSCTTEPDDIQHHTDYSILDVNGERLQSVQNSVGPFGENPAEVAITPGRYLVNARANGSGLVTIPVVVAEGQTTVVHLEGGYTDASMPKNAAVKLSNGQIIGWRASDQR